MNKTIAGLILAVAVAAAAVANAHPQLKAAGPAPGSTVKDSPKALRIQFSEGIELPLSGIEVTNEKGEKQATGRASLAPNDKALLIVPLTATLTPGKYTVTWHAVGGDTHHVEGRYNFAVEP